MKVENRVEIFGVCEQLDFSEKRKIASSVLEEADKLAGKAVGAVKFYGADRKAVRRAADLIQKYRKACSKPYDTCDITRLNEEFNAVDRSLAGNFLAKFFHDAHARTAVSSLRESLQAAFFAANCRISYALDALSKAYLFLESPELLNSCRRERLLGELFERFVDCSRASMREQLARDLNFKSWDELIKWDAGKYLAGVFRLLDIQKEDLNIRQIFDDRGARVIRFFDNSVYLSDPFEVWISWYEFLREHPEFAGGLHKDYLV